MDLTTKVDKEAKKEERFRKLGVSFSSDIGKAMLRIAFEPGYVARIGLNVPNRIKEGKSLKISSYAFEFVRDAMYAYVLYKIM